MSALIAIREIQVEIFDLAKETVEVHEGSYEALLLHVLGV
jgi:hypothetical protein